MITIAPLQTICIQIRPDETSGFIWIQTACHTDDIPEFFFEKVNFEKKSADNKNL